MKKFLFAALVLACAGAEAQSFRRGAVVIDLATGFEYFNVSGTYSNGEGGRQVKLKSNAASGNLCIGAEVGLSKHLGIGVRGKMNSFFHDLDALSRERRNMRSTDLIAFLNVHPVVRKHFDLILGGECGLSTLSILIDDLQRTQVGGKGAFLSCYVNPRFYWKRFGVNLRTYLPFVVYSDLSSTGEDPSAYFLSKWRGSGIGVAVGVQFRI